MKKTLTIIACCLFAASTGAFAQEKGEMAIGGSIGFSGGTNNSQTIIKLGDKTNKSDMNKNPNGTFTLAPEFSYFVIDNLQLNAGFRYDLENSMDKDYDEELLISNNGSHKYMFGIGLNYFVKVCNNFYYAPGFYYDFGGATLYNNERIGHTKTKHSESGFATGIELQVAKFEVKISKHFGLDLNLLSLDYDYIGLTEKVEEAKATLKTHDLDFRLGSHIGFKYYF